MLSRLFQIMLKVLFSICLQTIGCSSLAIAQQAKVIGVLQAGQEAPHAVTKLLEDFRTSGTCGCLPKFKIHWDNFDQPKYRFYTTQSVGRVLTVLKGLCKDFSEEICQEVKVVELDYKQTRNQLRLPYFHSGTLWLEAGPGYVPNPVRIKNDLVKKLDLDKPKAQSKRRTE